MPDKLTMIKAGAGVLAGIVMGLLLPALVKKIILIKNKKHGKTETQEILEKKRSKWLVVLADAILSGLTAFLLDPLPAVFAVLLMQIVIVSVLTDYYIRIIANEMVLLFLALGIGYRVASEGPKGLLWSLAALGLVTAVFGGTAFYMMKKLGTPGVGAGDLKFAMAIAIAVGWKDIAWFFIGIAGALAAYTALGMLSKKLQLRSYFAMCLQLSTGFVLAVLAPKMISLLS